MQETWLLTRWVPSQVRKFCLDFVSIPERLSVLAQRISYWFSTRYLRQWLIHNSILMSRTFPLWRLNSYLYQSDYCKFIIPDSFICRDLCGRQVNRFPWDTKETRTLNWVEQGLHLGQLVIYFWGPKTKLNQLRVCVAWLEIISSGICYSTQCNFIIGEKLCHISKFGVL